MNFFEHYIWHSLTDDHHRCDRHYYGGGGGGTTNIYMYPPEPPPPPTPWNEIVLKEIEKRFHRKSERERVSEMFGKFHEFQFPFIGLESRPMQKDDSMKYDDVIGLSFVNAHGNWRTGNNRWLPLGNDIFDRMFHVVSLVLEDMYGVKDPLFCKESFDLYKMVCYVKYYCLATDVSVASVSHGNFYNPIPTETDLLKMFLPSETWYFEYFFGMQSNNYVIFIS